MWFSNSCKSKNWENWLVLVLTDWNLEPRSPKYRKIMTGGSKLLPNPPKWVRFYLLGKKFWKRTGHSKFQSGTIIINSILIILINHQPYRSTTNQPAILNIPGVPRDQKPVAPLPVRLPGMRPCPIRDCQWAAWDHWSVRAPEGMGWDGIPMISGEFTIFGHSLLLRITIFQHVS